MKQHQWGDIIVKSWSADILTILEALAM